LKKKSTRRRSHRVARELKENRLWKELAEGGIEHDGDRIDKRDPLKIGKPQ
jgi:hypothetical protein